MPNPVTQVIAGTFADVHTSKKHDLGTTVLGDDGNLYIYCQGVASLAANDDVVIQSAGNVIRKAAYAGEAFILHGQAQAAFNAATSYGWVKISNPLEDKQIVSVNLPAFTASTTVNVGVMAVRKSILVTKVSVSVVTKPVDADGTCILNVFNYDASATADDTLATALDLETITTAKVSQDMTIGAAANLPLDANDFIYATLVNNSAAIDTNMAGGVLTIEYIEL